MNSYRFSSCLVGTLVLILTSSGVARGATLTYYDEDAFKLAAGALTMESFETIAIDSWIYKTSLSSPIPAVNLALPDHDLDGHFTITANSTFWAVPFTVTDAGSISDEVHGINFLQFTPWYDGSLWPDAFDPDEQHPIITIDNFDNVNSSINAFGLYFYNYTPGVNWIELGFGDQHAPVNLTGTTAGAYFFGVITDTSFSQVQLHTNQNGGSMSIDEIYYTAGPVIPEPGSVVLTALGLSGLALYGRCRKR